MAQGNYHDTVMHENLSERHLNSLNDAAENRGRNFLLAKEYKSRFDVWLFLTKTLLHSTRLISIIKHPKAISLKRLFESVVESMMRLIYYAQKKSLQYSSAFLPSFY